jgi:glycosyltransferase involved in cell wall biosynthesis
MKMISVIIRCYNEEEHIGRLLTGITQQTVKNIEIILVDSGSTDATLSIASRFPVKIVYISPDEFSFGRALNRGCREAQGNYLVFISAHCWPVYHDWLEQIVKSFADEKVALVYGKQRGNEITKFSEHQIFRNWFPEKTDLLQNHPFCNNANCAIRREIWERIPYNEDLTGLEDIDWAKRALDAGYIIAYSAEAEIIHVHQETPERIFNRYFREAIALKNIFPHEKFSFWDFLKLYSSNVYSDCIKAYREKILSDTILDIFQFRFMQFWGAYKGFSQRDPLSKKLKNTFYYPNNSPKHPPEYTRLNPIDYNRTESEES